MYFSDFYTNHIDFNLFDTFEHRPKSGMLKKVTIFSIISSGMSSKFNGEQLCFQIRVSMVVKFHTHVLLLLYS